MNTQEIAAMRQWITETARILSTLGMMPGADEISALPDERIVEVIERHCTGGVRLFRYCVENGLQP